MASMAALESVYAAAAAAAEAAVYRAHAVDTGNEFIVLSFSSKQMKNKVRWSPAVIM